MPNLIADKKTKHFHLSTKDKMLTGLCGGIGEYFNVDSSFVRLGYIFLTIITGLIPGVLTYIIASFVVPKE